MLTGHYTYHALGDPDQPRAVTVVAGATDPASGTWKWDTTFGSFSGTVTCLRVDGADAWLAGPVTSPDPLFASVFMWVHDGGAPGKAGDMAFTWGTDPWESLADMEALCETKAIAPYGDWFTVESGNLVVRP